MSYFIYTDLISSLFDPKLVLVDPRSTLIMLVLMAQNLKVPCRLIAQSIVDMTGLTVSCVTIAV